MNEKEIKEAIIKQIYRTLTIKGVFKTPEECKAYEEAHPENKPHFIIKEDSLTIKMY